LYLLVYVSILLYRNESERRSWKKCKWQWFQWLWKHICIRILYLINIMMNDDDCIIDDW